MAEILEVKGIRPKKLNVDVFRKEIEKALHAEGRDVVAEYEKTTATWQHKPRFEYIVDSGGADAAVLIGTDDKIYGYVDKGTRPHIIRPKRARRLRFQSGYRAKTSPGNIGSSAGGAFGPTVYARQVHHPGTKARNFTPTIFDRRKRKFTRRMSRAIQAGNKKMF